MAIWTQAQTNKGIRQIKKNGTHSVSINTMDGRIKKE